MERLSPSTLKVLLAVISIHRRRPVTVRSIQKALDFKSTGDIQRQLGRLEEAGLIAKEPHLGGTLRPTCTVTLFALTPTEEV